MSQDAMSAKQQEILEYIKESILKRGYPPAVREICQAVHLKSTSSVHSHLAALEEKGYIRRDPTKPRTIEILDDTFNFNRREMVNIPVVGTVAAGEPLLAQEGELSPLEVTTGIFRCLRDNADVCTVTLGPYGDKEFAARLISVGRERCLSSYARYFAGATRRQLEFYYAFVSAGCIGLLERWLAEGMTVPAEEMAAMAEGVMMKGIGFLEEK